MAEELTWYKAAALDELSEGIAKPVTLGNTTIALIHFKGKYSALPNKCPHQGGPLGEGPISNGMLQCPWHGWKFDPLTGKSPSGEEKSVCTYPTELREDGVYVGIKEEVKVIRTISDVMVETMINWGVTHVFGMVGHSNLGFAEAIRKQVKLGKLTYIGIRHEGAAAFAASAFAKLTGRPAACFAIAGPGATNLLTGLWDAKVDRVPILALTGQIDTQVLGPGAFQEVDLRSAFEGVAAWSQTVLPSSKHAELMTLALKNALLKRDVAHLMLPNEVQVIEADENAKASTPEGRITPQSIAPPQESIDKALHLIRASRRPVIIIGHGAKFQMDSVIQLAELLHAPVVSTFKAKGLIADDHPLGCGVLGRSGTPIASGFMNDSDLLIVLGASFSQHTGITPDKPTIQVDFDPMALGKFHKITAPVWGEIGVVSKRLIGELVNVDTIDQRDEVQKKWKLWKAEKLKREQVDHGNGINSASIFASLNRNIPENAVIAVDVGNNTYSFGRYFECKNQSVLMSGYLGSIGFGYPAAIGAWCAEPDRPTICITGDGGFGQYMAELTTAVKYNMNITHILVNNSQLGKISKEQRNAEFEVWETSLQNPNFSKFAKNCGAFGIRVTDKAELDEAVQKALSHSGPSLVEIIADPELI